jgi:hypothetical protein
MDEPHFRELQRVLKREFDQDPKNWGHDGPPADILLSVGIVAAPLYGPPLYSRCVPAHVHTHMGTNKASAASRIAPDCAQPQQP